MFKMPRCGKCIFIYNNFGIFVFDKFFLTMAKTTRAHYADLYSGKYVIKLSKRANMFHNISFFCYSEALIIKPIFMRSAYSLTHSYKSKKNTINVIISSLVKNAIKCKIYLIMIRRQSFLISVKTRNF